MGYQPFTNDYSSNLAGQQRAYARQAARRAQVNAQFANGNQIMGALTTDCCSDPAYGGQSYTDNLGSPGDVSAAALASLVPGTSTPAASGTSVSTTPSQALTPVDILTHSGGWQMQPNGKPWPRPRLPRSQQRAIANSYPNYGPMVAAASLVPPCPCFSSATPVMVPVPTVVTPAPAPVATPAPTPTGTAPCAYPGCSTGNICLDLVSGCVLNSQVDQAQVLACTLANYGVFGNMGTFLGQVMHGCQPPPYLGTPQPNPPTADASMRALIGAAAAKNGLSGLGQDDGGSQFGGFLAVVAMFGIVVWAIRK